MAFDLKKASMLKTLINFRAVLAPLIMLSAMWLGFCLQLLGVVQDCTGALVPLVPEGLKGVLFAPLLHGSLEHIMGNSVPVAVLMFLLYKFYPQVAKRVFFTGWIAAGLIVWLLPPIDVFTGKYSYSCVIGASGIVYVLAFFLFFSGIARREGRLLAVSLVVVLYYGGLVWGMLPEELFTELSEPSHISWQSHLAGAVTGTALAWLYRNVGEKKQKFIWEYPDYYSEKDDRLWQKYIEEHPEDFQEMPQLKKENIWQRLEDLRKES